MTSKKPDQHSDFQGDLARTREGRGYLLPHHGLMAIALPEVLEDYDRLYRSVALTARHLSVYEREAIWLAILATREEGLGTHHVAKFLDAGGVNEEMDALLAIAGLARGADVFEFARNRWAPHAEGSMFETAGIRALESVRGPLRQPLALMASAAAHACAGQDLALRGLLKACYEAAIDEYQLAEALSLVMLPGSIPNFARAAGVWLALIRSGEVRASEAFPCLGQFGRAGRL